MALRVGDACEVAGAAAEGFPHSWFRATVEAVVPSAAGVPPLLQASRVGRAARWPRTPDGPRLEQPAEH